MNYRPGQMFCLLNYQWFINDSKLSYIGHTGQSMLYNMLIWYSLYLIYIKHDLHEWKKVVFRQSREHILSQLCKNTLVTVGILVPLLRKKVIEHKKVTSIAAHYATCSNPARLLELMVYAWFECLNCALKWWVSILHATLHPAAPRTETGTLWQMYILYFKKESLLCKYK